MQSCCISSAISRFDRHAWSRKATGILAGELGRPHWSAGLPSKRRFSGPFDTARRIQHPTNVVVLSRRLTAIAAVLTLCAGNLAVCTGWQATPEARMACCRTEAACAMHESESHHSGTRHTVSQAQADNCCAGSEGTHSTTTNSTFVLSGIIVFAPATMPVVTSRNVPALQDWRALVPLPVSPVPKHLLLSVFIV